MKNTDLVILWIRRYHHLQPASIRLNFIHPLLLTTVYILVYLSSTSFVHCHLNLHMFLK